MKTHTASWRCCASLLLALAAGLALVPVRLVAADEPAPAPPPPKPAPAPAGAWFVFSPPSNADEVLAAASRVKMLTLAKAFLDRNAPDLQSRLKAAENPFYAKLSLPPESLVPAANSEPTATSSAPAGPPKMSDEDKLKTIGDNLQPTGILEGAGKRLVTFAGNRGGQLEVGQSFSSIVPPDTTPVTIILLDANDNSCVLKLNNTTVTVNYISKPSGASHSSAPSSTQPKSRD